MLQRILLQNLKKRIESYNLHGNFMAIASIGGISKRELKGPLAPPLPLPREGERISKRELKDLTSAHLRDLSNCMNLKKRIERPIHHTSTI